VSVISQAESEYAVRAPVEPAPDMRVQVLPGSSGHVSSAVLAYLARFHPEPLAFWTEAGEREGIELLAACDVLYALALMGYEGGIARDAPGRFLRLLAARRVPGRFTSGGDEPASVHLTAYALGVLNLLGSSGNDAGDGIFRREAWAIGELIDPKTSLPRWPSHLGHHTWRVSHWIGGTVSIAQSLWKLCPDLAERNGLPHVPFLLARADSLIDGETGLLKAYRSRLGQQAFRALYRLRHDPDAADIGGTVHLSWVNYANDRPYKGNAALHSRAWKILQRTPFMEKVPYCLDFDIIQIVRTSLEGPQEHRADMARRARRLADDVRRFYLSQLDETYSLHKLPGGLATMHECALASGSPLVAGLHIAPVDIIRRACWL